jgi:hypothetical protein
MSWVWLRRLCPWVLLLLPGRKVLRSSIREFLASEAMHYLHVPTTRGSARPMAAIGSGLGSVGTAICHAHRSGQSALWQWQVCHSASRVLGCSARGGGDSDD